MKIYLIRHGETNWNLSGKVQGNTDIELNGTGIRQAELMADHMKHIPLKQIYCSPLKRARVTAEMLGGMTRAEVIPKEEFREISFGQWEGLTWEEIERKHSESYRAWSVNSMESRAPMGESCVDVVKRCQGVVDKAIQEAKGDIAIVSHFITTLCILTYLFRENTEMEIPRNFGNASVTTLEYNRITRDIQLIEVGNNHFLR